LLFDEQRDPELALRSYAVPNPSRPSTPSAPMLHWPKGYDARHIGHRTHIGHRPIVES
jgi:hypothetical protein